MARSVTVIQRPLRVWIVAPVFVPTLSGVSVGPAKSKELAFTNSRVYGEEGEKLGKPQDYIDYEIDNLVSHDHVFFPCTNFIAGPFCEEEGISA